MKSNTILLIAGILLVSQIAPQAAAQTCGPFVTGSGMSGDFFLGVSYYGAIGIEDAPQRQADLDRFKSLGLNNVRVWANWTHWDALDSSVFDGDGDVNTDEMGRLVALVQEADARNMTVDVTFTFRHFRQNQCGGTKSVCLERFEDGLVATANSLVLSRNAFFDLANESNSGSTSYTLGDAAVETLAAAIAQVDASRVLTISSTGEPVDHKNRVDDLLLDGTIDFASPHFRRVRDWDTQTGDRIATLRGLLPGSWPIHLQEENRRGQTCGSNRDQWCCTNHEMNPPPDPESYCQLNDFKTALGLAAAEGAAGWVFHTDAGFELDDGTGSFWSRLDPVEKDVMEALASTLGANRCLPPPVYSDSFNDAQDNDYLRGRALQVGSALWDATGSEGPPPEDWRIEIEDGKATTASPNFAVVGTVPFHLPTGFSGKASVEAELSNYPNPDENYRQAEAVSIGFSEDPRSALEVDGVYWVSLEDDGNIHIYEKPGILLQTISFFVPVEKTRLKLEYEGGTQPKLRLFGYGGFTGWNQLVSLNVNDRAVDFAALEFDEGENEYSLVDDFAARYTP